MPTCWVPSKCDASWIYFSIWLLILLSFIIKIDYFTDLSQTAGVKNIKPVMTKLHNESSKCFNENLLHFREDNFAILDDETFIKLN